MSKTNLSKAAVIVVFFVVWWFTYALINAYGAAQGNYLTSQPIDVFPWLFQPWTAYIYVFLGVPIALVPFWVDWSWRGISRVLTAYAIALLLAFSTYIVFPVSIRRPDALGSGVGADLLRYVILVDDAANCLPSCHTTYAVLAGLFSSTAKSVR